MTRDELHALITDMLTGPALGMIGHTDVIDTILLAADVYASDQVLAALRDAADGLVGL